jgi:hypothetical protein
VRPKNKISGQFSYRTIEMMESPAFQVLSLAGHRILARVELELAHHGGNDNGRLPVTYDHFEEYGVHRHSIAAGLREVCALGFLEITQRGRAGNAEWRKPHYFRLTYRPVGNAKPTDDWRHIRTIEDAEAIAEHARRGTVRKKNKTPVAFSAENALRNPVFIVRNPPLLAIVRNPPLPLYSRVGPSPRGGCRVLPRTSHTSGTAMTARWCG